MLKTTKGNLPLSLVWQIKNFARDELKTHETQSFFDTRLLDSKQTKAQLKTGNPHLVRSNSKAVTEHVRRKNC